MGLVSGADTNSARVSGSVVSSATVGGSPKDLPAPGGGPVASELVYTLTLRCRPGWLARPLEAVAFRLFSRETSRRLTALRDFLGDPPDVARPGAGGRRSPKT